MEHESPFSLSLSLYSLGIGRFVVPFHKQKGSKMLNSVSLLGKKVEAAEKTWKGKEKNSLNL